MLLIMAIIIGVFFLWIYYIKTFRVWSRQGIAQTKPWPFLGDSWVTIFQVMNVAQFTDKIYYQDPTTRYTGCYQLQTPVLLIKDPELIKQIAIKDFDHFTDHKGISAGEVDPLFDRNIFLLKGQKWRDMRAVLSSSFTSSKMKIMYKLIAEASEKFVDHFWNNSDGFTDLELKGMFSRYANDVIASTAFGIEVDSLSNPSNEFYAMGREITNFNSVKNMLRLIGMMIFPKLFKLLKIPVFSKRATDFFSGVINESIRIREEQHIVRPDMLNILLEVRRGTNQQEHAPVLDDGFAVVEESEHIVKHHKKHMELTNTDILSQALLFFFAGFDTISSAISSCCYELALNPTVQDNLRQEIKNTFKESTEPKTYETILSMKYLDMVVSESFRKYPGFIAIDRMCTKPYTIEPSTPEEKPVHIKVGHVVFLPAYTIHHDPKYYPNPEKFIPERFSDENKAKIHPYTYMPFGIGPRACIGSRLALLEMKTMLVSLLDKFEVVAVEKTKIPFEMSKTTMNVMAKDGYHLGLKKIK